SLGTGAGGGVVSRVCPAMATMKPSTNSCFSSLAASRARYSASVKALGEAVVMPQYRPAATPEPFEVDQVSRGAVEHPQAFVARVQRGEPGEPGDATRLANPLLVFRSQQ